jgi:hypothetical protein
VQAHWRENRFGYKHGDGVLFFNCAVGTSMIPLANVAVEMDLTLVLRGSRRTYVNTLEFTSVVYQNSIHFVY